MATIGRLASIAAIVLLGGACSTDKTGLSAYDGAADRAATTTGGIATGTGGTTAGAGGTTSGAGGTTRGAGGTLAGTGGMVGSGGSTTSVSGLGGSAGGAGAGLGGTGGSGTGGRGSGGVAATGGAGSGGYMTGAGGAGIGGRPGTGGDTGRRGGTTGTARGGATGNGGAGTGGIQGAGGTAGRGAGGAGRGGAGGASTGTTCGGKICVTGEFCCGPPDCGYCANSLTGPNCQLTCGTSACGPTGTPCQPGEICLNVNFSMGPRNTITTQCVANPCGDRTLTCECAGTLCEDANPATMCTEAYPDSGALVCVGGGVCASPDTPIATPTGNRRIAELRRGDLVYSEHEGAIVAVPLLAVVRRPVERHAVVRIVTASGAILDISAPHPTADGRRFSDLSVGDRLDGDRIVAREVVAYPHAFTYDILPASSTGTYVAGGHLVGSTLGR